MGGNKSDHPVTGCGEFNAAIDRHSKSPDGWTGSEGVRRFFREREGSAEQKKVITTGRSLTEAIEGVWPEPLRHGAWRHVFERFNIAVQHAFKEFFHFGYLIKLLLVKRKKSIQEARFSGK